MTQLEDGQVAKARILIVDDQEANTRLLERILARAGYGEIRCVNDPRQALPVFSKQGPDIVLLDLHMPHLDGFAVMRQLTVRVPPGTVLPIVVLTADTGRDVKEKALAMGATDFLTKPFDPIEVVLRIRNHLNTRTLSLQLHDQNLRLEERVKERTKELEEARLEILERLARAAEYRDDETGHHIERVGSTSELLAEALGLPADEVELIGLAAPLHDVGKIGIPDAILLKPGRLTPQEREMMKTHTTIGARILGGSRAPVLRLAEEIALTHHEKWDGTGYCGLKGEEIPLSGRIVALADAYDAMTHERPYKEAWPLDRALEEIERCGGTHFDPRVVAAFLHLRTTAV